jgi:hypothetical protein
MQAALQEKVQLPLPDFDEDNKIEEESMPPEMEAQISEFEAQAAQLLAQAQPPNPEQEKESREAAREEGQLAIKQEEMSIRKDRFVQGAELDDRIQNRKDKELQLKAVDIFQKNKNAKKSK